MAHKLLVNGYFDFVDNMLDTLTYASVKMNNTIYSFNCDSCQKNTLSTYFVIYIYIFNKSRLEFKMCIDQSSKHALFILPTKKYPANMRRWSNVCLPLVQHLMFAGNAYFRVF